MSKLSGSPSLKSINQGTINKSNDGNFCNNFAHQYQKEISDAQFESTLSTICLPSSEEITKNLVEMVYPLRDTYGHIISSSQVSQINVPYIFNTKNFSILVYQRMKSRALKKDAIPIQRTKQTRCIVLQLYTTKYCNNNNNCRILTNAANGLLNIVIRLNTCSKMWI